MRSNVPDGNKEESAGGRGGSWPKGAAIFKAFLNVGAISVAFAHLEQHPNNVAHHVF